MVPINELTKILLKSKILPLELEKLSSKQSSVENTIKTIARSQSNVNLKELDFSLLKNYLPDRIPLGKVLDSLFHLLSSSENINITPRIKQSLMTMINSLIDQGEDIDENVIKNVIDKTGLNYESKLKKILLGKTEYLAPAKADGAIQGVLIKESLKNGIKGLLMELMRELETKLKISQQKQSYPGLKEIQLMIKNVKTTLANIELNQILNYYAKQEEGYFQIQIPYSRSETIQLYIKDNSKGKNQKKNKKEDISLVFFLNLKEMGNLRIDLHLYGKSLSCNFFAEKKDVSKFIDTLLPELKHKLEDNYDTSYFCCTVKSKKFFEEGKPEIKLFKKKTQIISVKV